MHLSTVVLGAIWSNDCLIANRILRYGVLTINKKIRIEDGRVSCQEEQNLGVVPFRFPDVRVLQVEGEDVIIEQNRAASDCIRS